MYFILNYQMKKKKEIVLIFKYFFIFMDIIFVFDDVEKRAYCNISGGDVTPSKKCLTEALGLKY